MKQIILIIILLVAIAAGWYAYKEYNRKEVDLKGRKPDVAIDATALITAFKRDTVAASKQYVDKVIAVSGLVTKIDAAENPVVIFLGDTSQMSSVKCSMDSTYAADYATIRESNHVTIKGICTGGEVSDLGLGTDVSLKRSVIDNKDNK